MFIGIALIIIGTLYLMDAIGIITLTESFWSVFWPIVSIFVGIYIVSAVSRLERIRKHWFWSKFFSEDSHYRRRKSDQDFK